MIREYTEQEREFVESWRGFLAARARMIRAFRRDGKSYEEIAVALSMDAEQARGIGEMAIREFF